MHVPPLRDIAARHFQDFVASLEQMVNVDCGSYSAEGVNVIADLYQTRMRVHE
jgi:hypothetical protein